MVEFVFLRRKQIMRTTHEYEIEKLDDAAIQPILTRFKGRSVKIVVEKIKKESKPSQWELYQEALKVRGVFKNSKIDPDINLSDLANEVNL